MYHLIFTRESDRRETYRALGEIERDCEGIDWLDGNYRVVDDQDCEYVPRWIRRPSVSKGLFFGWFKVVDIGSYRLVPRTEAASKATESGEPGVPWLTSRPKGTQNAVEAPRSRTFLLKAAIWGLAVFLLIYLVGAGFIFGLLERISSYRGSWMNQHITAFFPVQAYAASRWRVLNDFYKWQKRQVNPPVF
jgi:hypothetical protein